MPSAFTAYDVWSGYLLLDAWTSARDRHHENWGLIERGAADRSLAPSFDHGNALGFQERDERRAQMLADEAHLHRWLGRGVSRHFAGRPALTNLALDALRLASPAASAYWIDRLDQVADAAVVNVLAVIPQARMPDTTRRFVLRLLATNRRRLRDGYSRP